MTRNPGKPPRTTKALRIQWASSMFPHLAGLDERIFDPAQWKGMNWKIGRSAPPLWIEGCEFVAEDAR
ncbi:hypothetical protein WJS89_10460 [Sphingomicrobium sp. XHP0235]|uniref:hypothetical protein n=1 Tax=Sphingomicrobium aquimarinum TaxID=3133971 RepID=UPI0031FF32D6